MCAHVFIERHGMNMPLRNIPVQSIYSDEALKSPAAIRHHRNMAKRQHFIREWRKFRDLNQTQLADAVGISQSFISKFETFQVSPDLATLTLIAGALKCDVVDLIKREPDTQETIWGLWDQLQPTQKTQLVEIGQTLKKVS